MARQKRRRRRGAAAVELAIVLPFLLALVLGMLEIGRAIMATNALTTAAREGVRAGVVANGDNAKITAAVNSSLTAQKIPLSNVQVAVKVNNVTANVSSAATGAAVSVTVSVPYHDVKWVPSPDYLVGKTLTATAVMRRE